MPLPLAAIGLGLGAAGLASSLYGQNQARKDAKKAAEKQRKMDLMQMILQVSGGQGISGVNPSAPLPVVDAGGAMTGAGELARRYASDSSDSDYKTKYLEYLNNTAQSRYGQSYDPSLYQSNAQGIPGYDPASNVGGGFDPNLFQYGPRR